jgi:hypothetical protein
MASTSEKLQQIIDRLVDTPVKDLPEQLKTIRELRTGERRPSAPILYGYPSTDNEIAAYERIIEQLARPIKAARLPERSETINPCATLMGGQPYAIAGDQWPGCPQCGVSLSFIGQISEALTLQDGSTNYLLNVIYCCLDCKPQVTDGQSGFVIAPYWNASPEKAVPMRPAKPSSAPAQPTRVPVFIEDQWYLPSISEIDVEDLGIPIQYYIKRYDQVIDDVRSKAHMLGGGPYPPGMRLLQCPDCGTTAEAGYTLLLDAMYSIIACPRHPHQPICFRTELDDEVGDVHQSSPSTHPAAAGRPQPVSASNSPPVLERNARLQRIDRFNASYEEGGKTVTIPVDPLGAGDGLLVYLSDVFRWNEPHQATAITDDDRQRIRQAFIKVYSAQSMKVEFE